MRRRGELSPARLDREWPYQVAVKRIPGQNLGHINPSGPFSSLCWRRHHIGDGQHTYEVLCFSDKAQADQFRDKIQGEAFDPRDRVGSRWVRGRGVRRDEKRKLRGY